METFVLSVTCFNYIISIPPLSGACMSAMNGYDDVSEPV